MLWWRLLVNFMDWWWGGGGSTVGKFHGLVVVGGR
jgi:hypothetical protein